MSSSQDSVKTGQNFNLQVAFPALNNDFQDQRQLFRAKFTALGFTIPRKVSNVIEAIKNFNLISTNKASIKF